MIYGENSIYTKDVAMDKNRIDLSNGVPKRKYIVDYLSEEIRDGKLQVGNALPSINELCERFGVSRVTAVAAYRELKTLGLIRSNPRKGFQVASANANIKQRIFLFLDELSGFKEPLYNGLKEGIGKNGTVDVFFHHFNAKVFETIIRDNVGNYTAYVVMPIQKKNCGAVLKQVPEGKLYIIDTGLFPFGKMYPSVCQNFEKDMLVGLTSGLDLLRKYRKMILVYPEEVHTQQGIIRGVKYFCNQNGLAFERVLDSDRLEPVKGECYMVLMDSDLVNVVNAVSAVKLKLGRDIGVISQREAPLKAIVANGITTLSTDFRFMGQTMAEMILKRKKDQIENPCYMIRRKSL